MTNGPQALDETSPDDDGFDGMRRNSAFRVAAVLVCGIGLATACVTLLRLSQDHPQGRGEKAIARAERPPAPAPRQARAEPPAAVPAALPVPAAAEPVPAAPPVPAIPAPAGPAKNLPSAGPDSTASLSPAAPGAHPTIPQGAPGDVAAKPGASAAIVPQSAPQGPAPALDSGDTKAAARPRPRSPQAAYDVSGQFREDAAPLGSGPNVRAYTFANEGGEIDPHGIRRVVVRMR